MTDIVERLRSPASVFYEYPADNGALLKQAANEIEKLRTALRELIYETTHLSPQEDDGSHRCTITGETLRKARAALGEKQ